MTTAIPRFDLDDEATIKCKHCAGTGEIEAADHLDLDSIDAVRGELIYVVTQTTYGITSGNRIDRMTALGRIGFLASRLVWLEAIDFQRQPGAVIPV